MARGIPSSPRRSHRGGHSKSKKIEEEEEDDGGQTRCVCNQQHHEGVMIQCETCKVWQHCPCVGLGDGEVTPDKYYCDSCRPENHPYRVQDGQLISGSKRTSQQTPLTTSTNSKAKSSKKRSTINSKDSSSSECPSVEQFEENIEHVSNGNGHARASKRRKKSESGADETGPAIAGNNYSQNRQDSEEYGDDYIPTDNGTESYTDSTNNSSKVSSKNPRNSKSKKGINKSSNNYTSPDSPNDSNENNDSNDAEPSHISTQQHTSRKANGRKSNHSIESEVISGEKPAIVKRKKAKKSDTPQKEETLASADNYEESSQGLKRESSVDAMDSNEANTFHDSNPAPQSTVKRTGSRKGHTHTTGSDTFTPSGTPQPMQPASPAKVKYPSSRMTLKDMNKRAQQLLEYIGRIQVEMSEIKHRNYQKNSNKENGEVTHQAKSQGLTVDTEMQPIKVASGDADSRWLSTPPQSVHEMSHIDNSEQAIKTVPKSSVDQTCISLSPEGNGKVPMTPPHQLTLSSCSTAGEKDRSDAPSCQVENSEISVPVPIEITSLDLMDKLTGDLIRFQTKFGRYGE